MNFEDQPDKDVLDLFGAVRALLDECTEDEIREIRANTRVLSPGLNARLVAHGANLSPLAHGELRSRGLLHYAQAELERQRRGMN